MTSNGRNSLQGSNRSPNGWNASGGSLASGLAPRRPGEVGSSLRSGEKPLSYSTLFVAYRRGCLLSLPLAP